MPTQILCSLIEKNKRSYLNNYCKLVDFSIFRLNQEIKEKTPKTFSKLTA
jgi:hypothetical protein